MTNINKLCFIIRFIFTKFFIISLSHYQIDGLCIFTKAALVHPGDPWALKLIMSPKQRLFYTDWIALLLGGNLVIYLVLDILGF